MLNFFRHSNENYEVPRMMFHRSTNSSATTYPTVAVRLADNRMAVGSSNAPFHNDTAAGSSRTVASNAPEVGFPATVADFDTAVRFSAPFCQPFRKRNDHLKKIKGECKRRGSQPEPRAEPHGYLRKRETRTHPHEGVTDWNFTRTNYSHHVTLWLNEQTCDGNVRRRRKVSRLQRMAANQRERNRMELLNAAFDDLRSQLPLFPHEKRLSRIQTLRLAIGYIDFMMNTLSAEGTSGEERKDCARDQELRRSDNEYSYIEKI